MGVMVFSLLWVMQDLDHQPYKPYTPSTRTCSFLFRLSYLKGHAPQTTSSLHCSSFFGLTSSIVRILKGNPKKELQWRQGRLAKEWNTVQEPGKPQRDMCPLEDATDGAP